MSRPYFSVKHVENMSLLPENLTPGRIYFIDDEQVIIINHGNGLPPVVYGGKPGPQGASGEPQPQLQDQIDTVAQTEMKLSKYIWEEGLKFRRELARLQENFSDTFDFLRELTEKNALAILTLSDTIKQSFDNYDSAIATLGKAVANLYPDTTWHDDDETPSGGQTPDTSMLAQTLNKGDILKFSGSDFTVSDYSVGADGSITLGMDSHGDFSDKSDPLDDDIVTTNAGTWTIQQTRYKDGSTLLDLTQTKSLNTGDSVQAGGNTYTVSSITTNPDGSISVEIS